MLSEVLFLWEGGVQICIFTLKNFFKTDIDIDQSHGLMVLEPWAEAQIISIKGPVPMLEKDQQLKSVYESICKMKTLKIYGKLCRKA
jgi:hypothetical protein